MKGYVFPGQGSQYPQMGKDLYENNSSAKNLFEKANEILGFDITEVMFNGTAEDLKKTQITQPAVFLHSVISATMQNSYGKPDMVAGHSLGELSALVVNETLSFPDGLRLVYQRAQAMQAACEQNPSTMAAIIGLGDEQISEICDAITDEIVVPANFNCPGQVVISGSNAGIDIALERLKEAGAKRALKLPVGGAFHSPLMEPASVTLEKAIHSTKFSTPTCPIYQNVNGKPCSQPSEIKQNLIAQLTSPVQWTQLVQNMIADGCTSFKEFGPGKVLQGLIRKIDRNVEMVLD